MDNKNFAIGVLSTTAVVLFVGLMVVQSRPVPAYAHGMTESAGNYVLTVASVAEHDYELLHIINNAKEKMNVYSFDARSHTIQMVDTIDLKQMRSLSAKAKPSQKKRGGRRRP